MPNTVNTQSSQLQSSNKKGLSPFFSPFVDFGRNVEDFWNDFYCKLHYPSVSDNTKIVLTPRINIAENDKTFEVHAELPGVKKGDITVTCSDGVLTISAERKSEKEEKSKSWHKVESYYGVFERHVKLAESVNEDSIVADFADGILKITIEKKHPTPRKEAKRVAIK